MPSSNLIVLTMAGIEGEDAMLLPLVPGSKCISPLLHHTLPGASSSSPPETLHLSLRESPANTTWSRRGSSSNTDTSGPN